MSYGFPSLSEEDIEEVTEVLRQALTTGSISRGEKVRQFEEEVAEYVQAPYAVAFANASSALWAAYEAVKLNQKDLLLTSANTFVATASYAPLVGASVEFIDIDLLSGNMQLDALLIRLKQRKSQGRYVVAPVHFAGIAMDMRKLQQGIVQEDTVVIEDAAHAFGSFYPSGEPVGSCSYSDMTIFSFHPVKNITTGEGGMVTTRNREYYERLLKLRNSGIEREKLNFRTNPEPWYYEVHDIACQGNVTEFQAALGISQLRRLPGFVDKRRKLVQRYRTHLTAVPGLSLFSPEYDAKTAYHLFVAQIEFDRFGHTRSSFMQRLKEHDIGSQLHYVPMYYHSIFGKKPELENMQRYFQTALTLPLYVDLTFEQVDDIATKIKNILIK